MYQVYLAEYPLFLEKIYICSICHVYEERNKKRNNIIAYQAQKSVQLPLPSGPQWPPPPRPSVAHDTAPAPAMPNPHPTPACRPPPPSHCLHSKLQLPIPKSQTLGEQGKRGGRRRAQLGGARHSARAHGGRRRRSAWLGGARRQRSTWLGGGAQLNSGCSARRRPAARRRGRAGKRRLLGAARMASRRPAPARRASVPDYQRSGRAAQAVQGPHAAASAGPAAGRAAGELLRRSSPPPPTRFRPPQTLHRLHSSGRKAKRRRAGSEAFSPCWDTQRSVGSRWFPAPRLHGV